MTENLYDFNYEPKKCLKSLYFHLMLNSKFVVNEKHEDLLKKRYSPDRREKKINKRWVNKTEDTHSWRGDVMEKYCRICK